MSEFTKLPPEYHRGKNCNDCKKRHTPGECNYYLQYGILPSNESDIGEKWKCHQAENDRKTMWKPKHGYFPQNSEDTDKIENAQGQTNEIKVTPILGQGSEYRSKTIGFHNPFAETYQDPSNIKNNKDNSRNPFVKNKILQEENFEQRIKEALKIKDVRERTEVMQQIAKDKMEFKKSQRKI